MGVACRRSVLCVLSHTTQAKTEIVHPASVLIQVVVLVHLVQEMLVRVDLLVHLVVAVIVVVTSVLHLVLICVCLRRNGVERNGQLYTMDILIVRLCLLHTLMLLPTEAMDMAVVVAEGAPLEIIKTQDECLWKFLVCMEKF